MTRARLITAASAGASLLALGGCISVKTPEKPIEINLNVVIRQEVVVRLQRDVENLIEANPGAFPGTTPSAPPVPPRER
ncbi:MAG: YnbE family lipoprotein [Pseudomonadota bacterium]|nr:YnbE family lipoprotein [Pseudomonadota bacterium]